MIISDGKVFFQPREIEHLGRVKAVKGTLTRVHIQGARPGRSRMAIPV
ncbi:MAG: hypothetical protein R3B95_05840 [Nitrospirales bacterium]|nr:hypothetical protein [Nitrospirales bacterium]